MMIIAPPIVVRFRRFVGMAEAKALKPATTEIESPSLASMVRLRAIFACRLSVADGATAFCGDGRITDGEVCDDGNTSSNDYCV